MVSPPTMSKHSMRSLMRKHDKVRTALAADANALEQVRGDIAGAKRELAELRDQVAATTAQLAEARRQLKKATEESDEVQGVLRELAPAGVAVLRAELLRTVKRRDSAVRTATAAQTVAATADQVAVRASERERRTRVRTIVRIAKARRGAARARQQRDAALGEIRSVERAEGLARVERVRAREAVGKGLAVAGDALGRVLAGVFHNPAKIPAPLRHLCEALAARDERGVALRALGADKHSLKRARREISRTLHVSGTRGAQAQHDARKRDHGRSR